MRRIGLLFLFLFTACDHADETSKESLFPKDDVLGREVSGRVRRGLELTDGASVKVTARPGFRGDEKFVSPGPVVTDEAGFFRFRQAPIQYDLAIRLNDDLAQFQRILYRGFDAPFADPVPPRAFVSKILVDVQPPPTHAVAYFATGDGVWDNTGDATTGISVSSQTFAPFVTLHVVEYDGTLEHPIASGHADVTLSNAVVTTPLTVHTTPIPKNDVDVELDADVPEGAVLDPIPWGLTFFSNSQIRVVASVPRHTHVVFTPIPDARYTYSAHARKAGAETESGILNMPIFDKIATAPLNDFPTTDPAADFVFTAHAVGVREHKFVPVGGGTTVRVLSIDDAVAYPDVASLGAKPAHGKAMWSVKAWPSSKTMEGFQGADVRTFTPWSSTAPILIDLP